MNVTPALMIALAGLCGCGRVLVVPPPPEDVPVLTRLSEGWTALEGRTVTLEGRYEAATIEATPRDAGPPPAPPPEDGPAWVVLDDDSRVLLGVYYQPGGQRPAAERTALHGRRVRVTGIFHQSVPEQVGPGGEVSTTLVAPWLEGASVRPVP